MRGALQHLIDLVGGPRYRIFISYRRQGEGAGYAGRLADNVLAEFGDDQCFRDIDDIESGVDFVQSINHAVGTCDVLIAVIGRDWSSMANAEGQRRLDDPNDFVRLEIAAALSRDIRVIPVLVGGATMPRAADLPDAIEAFSRRQAHEISDTRWEYDVGKLIDAIEAVGIRRKRKGSAFATGKPRLVAKGLVGAIAVAVTATVLVTQGTGDGLFRSPVASDLTGEPPGDPADRESGPGDIDRTNGETVGIPDAEGDRGDGVKASAPAATARNEPVKPSPSRSTSRLAQEAVESTLHEGVAAQLEAFRTLDPSALYSLFRGDALTENIAFIAQLRGSGTHMDVHHRGYDVLSVDIDGSEAVAGTRESWSAELHQNGTDLCLGSIPLHTATGEVYLARLDGQWTITGMWTPDPAPDVVAGC